MPIDKPGIPMPLYQRYRLLQETWLSTDGCGRLKYWLWGGLRLMMSRQMDEIINEVITVTKNWKKIADQIGISRAEQDLMGKAFSSGF